MNSNCCFAHVSESLSTGRNFGAKITSCLAFTEKITDMDVLVKILKSCHRPLIIKWQLVSILTYTVRNIAHQNLVCISLLHWVIVINVCPCKVATSAPLLVSWQLSITSTDKSTLTSPSLQPSFFLPVRLSFHLYPSLNYVGTVFSAPSPLSPIQKSI